MAALPRRTHNGIELLPGRVAQRELQRDSDSGIETQFLGGVFVEMVYLLCRVDVNMSCIVCTYECSLAVQYA